MKFRYKPFLNSVTARKGFEFSKEFCFTDYFVKMTFLYFSFFSIIFNTVFNIFRSRAVGRKERRGMGCVFAVLKTYAAYVFHHIAPRLRATIHGTVCIWAPFPLPSPLLPPKAAPFFTPLYVQHAWWEKKENGCFSRSMSITWNAKWWLRAYCFFKSKTFQLYWNQWQS